MTRNYPNAHPARILSSCGTIGSAHDALCQVEVDVVERGRLERLLALRVVVDVQVDLLQYAGHRSRDYIKKKRQQHSGF